MSVWGILSDPLVTKKEGSVIYKENKEKKA